MMNIPIDSIICHDVTKPFPLPDECIDVVITSPPYWGLRDYGVDGQIGLESHPQEYIDKLVQICREIKRVLKKSGSFYINLGDTFYGSAQGYGASKKSKTGFQDVTKGFYASSKQKPPMLNKWPDKWLRPKQLLLIPSRVAIALQDDGWLLRSDIIWHKPNPMPSSVKDRLNNTFEHVFHFVKGRKYYFDLDGIREPHAQSGIERCKKPVSDWHGATGDSSWCQTKDNPDRHIIELNPLGKNPGDFWDICTQPFTGYNPELEHFAVFPEELVERPLKSSCPMQICKKCGKSRTRITKPTEEYEKYLGTSWYNHKDDLSVGQRKNDTKGHRTTASYETIGWYDCRCDAGWDSGVVLDPFAGRGTVGKVAKRLGLHYILFDIKPEYCELSRLFIGGQKYKVHKTQANLDFFT